MTIDKQEEREGSFQAQKSGYVNYFSISLKSQKTQLTEWKPNNVAPGLLKVTVHCLGIEVSFLGQRFPWKKPIFCFLLLREFI